jgi:hypothetical protein
VTLRTGLGRALVALSAAGAAWAGASEDEKHVEAERAVATLWLTNAAPVCLSLGLLQTAEQHGVQELERRFAPGLWAIRVPYPEGTQPTDVRRAEELERLDYLARHGLLEKREARVTVGPIEGARASEYRPTNKAWAISQGRPDMEIPCLHYGMTTFLRMTGYTESEEDARGLSMLQVEFRIGVGEALPWAATDEAKRLFPALREAFAEQPRSQAFYRGPDGKLRLSRDTEESLDYVMARRDAALAPRMPDQLAIRDAIDELQRSPGLPPHEALPPACLALDGGSEPPLWKAGSDSTLQSVRLNLDPTSSTQRALTLRTYGRLARLARAGLITLQAKPVASGLLLDVTPAPGIANLLAAHGSCLPVGDVRTEILGFLPNDRWGWGSGIRFKARYVIVRPERWITELKERDYLPDLVAWLDHGLYFEGTVFPTAATPGKWGWRAGYIVTSTPAPTMASLKAIGMSSMWRAAGQRAISPVSAQTHQLETVRLSGSGSSEPEVGVELRVRRSSKPMAIVLTAYRPTQWKFSLEKGARIEAVVALGYHRQRITGLSPGVRAVVAHAAGDEGAPDPAATHDDGLWQGGWVRLMGAPPYAAATASEGERIFVGGR